MINILMVCLGNICRSPLAEGILTSKIDLNSVYVDSAGTAAYHIGKGPDIRSIAVAKLNDIDISKQKARQFKVADFDNFDHIYAMDTSNYEHIIKLSRNKADVNKVSLILNVTKPGLNLSVPDPYYDTEKGFKNVYEMLHDACSIIANNLKG